MDMQNVESDHLHRLLSLARQDAAALRMDLADIECARASSEVALTSHYNDMRRELDSRNAKKEPYDSGDALVEALRTRQLHLQAAVLTLAETAEKTRQKLETAALEINKLEGLLSFATQTGLQTHEQRNAS